MKYVNGFQVDDDGTLQIGPPPIVGYAMGLPFNAAGGLVVQLDVPPVTGDAYVGGVRVVFLRFVVFVVRRLLLV